MQIALECIFWKSSKRYKVNTTAQIIIPLLIVKSALTIRGALNRTHTQSVVKSIYALLLAYICEDDDATSHIIYLQRRVVVVVAVTHATYVYEKAQTFLHKNKLAKHIALHISSCIEKKNYVRFFFYFFLLFILLSIYGGGDGGGGCLRCLIIV